jgi:hypothetical protein
VRGKAGKDEEHVAYHREKQEKDACGYITFV